MSGDGFFSTPANQPDLLLRLKSGMDSSEPSINGISASNLHRLASFLDDESYANLASRTLGAFESEILQHPFLFVSLLHGVVIKNLGMKTIVITGTGERIDNALAQLRTSVGVTTTVVRLGAEEYSSEWVTKRNKLLQSMDPDRPGVWVCEAGVCKEELELGAGMGTGMEMEMRDVGGALTGLE